MDEGWLAGPLDVNGGDGDGFGSIGEGEGGVDSVGSGIYYLQRIDGLFVNSESVGERVRNIPRALGLVAETLSRG
jgi:hypothetical protein